MIGIFSKTTDSNFVEAAGLAGLDFIILDREHGPVSENKLHDHVRAARLTDMKAIVRVHELNHNAIGSALDAGADGVQVPNISSLEEAEAAIRAARFYPLGERGVCRFVAGAEFGLKDKAAYFRDSNSKMLILQVEGKKGLDSVEEILKLDGFDVLFIGPYDLSQSLGFPGEVDHPEVKAAIARTAALAKAAGKALGTFTDHPEHISGLAVTGFSFLACSVDVNIFLSACARFKDSVK